MKIAIYFVVQLVVFPGLWQLVPQGVEDRYGMCRDMLMILALPLLLWNSFRGAIGLSGSMDERWFQTSDASDEFLQLYISTQLFTTVLDLATPGTWKSKLPMFVHHLFSIICYGNGLVTRRMHFWGCMDGCCEATTVFLMVVNLGRVKGGGVEEKVKAFLGIFWVVNGVCLWLSFIVFRLLLFPTWLYMFCVDAYKMDISVRSRLSVLELTAYPMTTVLLLGLSSMWFVRIHAGMMKALKGGGEKKSS